MKQGFYGIGIYETKESSNVGTLWRSAMNFGADYIFTIGARYKRQRGDTTKTWRNIPLFAFKDWDDFKAHVPRDGELVFVEQTSESHDLRSWKPFTRGGQIEGRHNLCNHFALRAHVLGIM